MDLDFSASAGFAPSQQQLTTQVVGLIVPGGPVRTDFVPVDASGTKFSLVLNSPGDLPTPLSLVPELVGFVVPNAPIPTNHGILLYWQLSTANGQSGFEILGSLTPEKQSEVFRTGWAEHDQFLGLQPGQQCTISIGVSIEPLESVINLSSGVSSVDARRPFVAQKIGQDLYNFMQSFDTNAGANQQMIVPTNIFERWWKRFEAKSKRDPNFFLKSSG